MFTPPIFSVTVIADVVVVVVVDDVSCIVSVFVLPKWVWNGCAQECDNVLFV